MRYRREFFRQLIHATGIVFVILAGYLNATSMIILSLGAAICGEIIFQLDRRFYLPFFSGILRGCRRDDTERGFIFYFIGMALTYAFFGFNMAVANASIIILTVGDSLSTIIGREYGEHPLPLKPDKSIEGSAAFLAAGFLGSLFFLEPIYAITGALTGMLVEAYTPVEDNIVIPLVTGAALLLYMGL
mgnify:CR=1 FL=1